MPQTSLLCIIPFVKFLEMSASVQCLNMCVTSVRHCKEAFISRNVAKGMTQRRLDCGINTIFPQLQLISFLQFNRLYPFHVASGPTYCGDKVLDSFHELSEGLALTDVVLLNTSARSPDLRSWLKELEWSTSDKWILIARILLPTSHCSRVRARHSESSWNESRTLSLQYIGPEATWNGYNRLNCGK